MALTIAAATSVGSFMKRRTRVCSAGEPEVLKKLVLRVAVG